MTEIRKIDIELEKRVETGPIQFDDDWPGVFIRGDNATYYAMCLNSLLDNVNMDKNDPFVVGACHSLLSDLRSCRV